MGRRVRDYVWCRNRNHRALSRDMFGSSMIAFVVLRISPASASFRVPVSSMSSAGLVCTAAFSAAIVAFGHRTFGLEGAAVRMAPRGCREGIRYVTCVTRAAWPSGEFQPARFQLDIGAEPRARAAPRDFPGRNLGIDGTRGGMGQSYRYAARDRRSPR